MIHFSDACHEHAIGLRYTSAVLEATGNAGFLQS